MVKNYLRVAFRAIVKHKFFSIINILGLSVGLASCLFISMYIYDELNYDHFHPDGERIYRMNLHGKLAGQEIHTANTSFPMYKALVDQIPEVEEATRVNNMGEWIMRNGTMAFNEEGVFAVDSNYFEFFGFELLQGNPETVLNEPNSIVLSQELAKKYFGDEPAVGKSLSIGNDKSEYEVTGVMENPRSNSHLKPRALLSSSTFEFMQQTSWLSNSLYTYYKAQEGATSAIVDEKLDPIVETNVTPALKQFINKSLEEFRKEGGIYTYFSFPMYDIHLRSQVQDEEEPPSDISYVYILGGIGIFIMLLACINFMNLTTAKSADRAKEVGLRKTLGSLRSAMIIQFLAESMIYAIGAALLAVIAVYILLPSFNTLSGKVMSFGILLEPAILLTLIGLTLLVGIIAGSYPAFYLTSFKITEVLKGKIRAGVKSGGIRSVLVTFQFLISIVLIICTGVVFMQLQFIQDKNLGIDKEHLLVIEDVSRLETNRTPFKNQLDQNSSIIATSYSNNMVPGVNNTTLFRNRATENDHVMATYYTDEDHNDALGFELVEGRYFSRDFKSDSNAVVINEAAAREMGWENPLEEQIIDFNTGEERVKDVIGVVKDFNFESLKFEVRPLILQLTDVSNILYVRFSGENPADVIEYINNTWDEYSGGDPLQYSFIGEDFDALFRAEQRLGQVFTVFTVMAIFIACLGLFGLAAFMAEQRTKEIGVRKVMGASVWSVTSLMSKEFSKLVGIAFLISLFPAYYIMDNWLDNFASRIDMPFWLFVVSGLSAFVIAWLTVSFQSFKAARANPVKSLRYE